jgi:hypothetical protein
MFLKRLLRQDLRQYFENGARYGGAFILKLFDELTLACWSTLDRSRGGERTDGPFVHRLLSTRLHGMANERRCRCVILQEFLRIASTVVRLLQ